MGALLTASFLARREWVMRWRGYEARAQASLLRVRLSIDGDVVASHWRSPLGPVSIRALVNDPQFGLVAFRAELTRRWGRQDCQIFINDERLHDQSDAPDRAPSGAPADDARLGTAQRLLNKVRAVEQSNIRVQTVTTRLESCVRDRLITLHRLGDPSGPTDPDVLARHHTLSVEVNALMDATRRLHLAYAGGEAVLAEEAVRSAEALLDRLGPHQPMLAARTRQLKTARSK